MGVFLWVFKHTFASNTNLGLTDTPSPHSSVKSSVYCIAVQQKANMMTTYTIKLPEIHN
jgi:hypothetical protein